MKKKLLLLFLSQILPLLLLAQNDTIKTIKLTNGDTFVGNVVWQNKTILVLQTEDNRRFQFRHTDIQKISNKTISQKIISPNKEDKTTIFIAATGGYAVSKQANIYAPKMGINLTIGKKQIIHNQAFVGIGVGYERFFDKNSISLSYIPMYIAINYHFSKQKTSPIIGSRVGYLFAINEKYKGATMCQLLGGFYHQTTDNMAFHTGLLLSIRQINGLITEKNRLGTYISKGNTILYSFGIEFAMYI